MNGSRRGDSYTFRRLVNQVRGKVRQFISVLYIAMAQINVHANDFDRIMRTRGVGIRTGLLATCPVVSRPRTSFFLQSLLCLKEQLCRY